MIWYIYHIQCQMWSTNNIKMNTYWTMMIGSQTYINIYSHRFTSIVWPSRTHKSKGHYLLVWTNSNNGPEHINHIHEHKVSTPKHLKHQMVRNTHQIRDMFEVGFQNTAHNHVCSMILQVLLTSNARWLSIWKYSIWICDESAINPKVVQSSYEDC